MAKWGGWIPSLSGDVFLTNAKEYLTRQKYILEQLNNVDYYWNYATISDKEIIEQKSSEERLVKERVIIEIVPPKSPRSSQNRVNFRTRIRRSSNFSQKRELYYDATIDVYRTGLTIIKGSPKKKIGFDRSYAILVYNTIKDIYHEHTHHSQSDEQELLDIFKVNKNYEEIMFDVFTQYRRKILYYHHFLRVHKQLTIWTYLWDIIRDMVKLIPGINRLRPRFPRYKPSDPSGSYFIDSYLLQAQGEMLYAQTALDLFSDYFTTEEKMNLSRRFDNAYKSFHDFREKFRAIMQDITGKLIVGLSIVLVILSIALCWLT